MCGKYIVSTEDENVELRQIIADIQRNYEGVSFQTGNVLPSQTAPALTRGGARPLRWGFPRLQGKGLIINARSETAAGTPLFAPLLRATRCLLPASGFYEWDGQKVCHTFSSGDGGTLYMAGLYRPAEPLPLFVILTCEADHQVSPVHPRMPCILPSRELREMWLQSDSLASDILHALPQVSLLHTA